MQLCKSLSIPTAAGNRAATITVANSAANQTLTLAGFGRSLHAFGVRTATPAWFSRTRWSPRPAPTKNITLANNGDVPLTIASVGVSGADMGDFTPLQ